MLKRILLFLLLTVSYAFSYGAPPVVLTYHGVTPFGYPADTSLSVSSDELSMQIQWLKLSGWTIIPSSALIAGKLPDNSPLPAKSVVLTFDDAEKSTCTTVYPLLKAQNVPFTVGIVTSWIENSQYPNSGKYCTWDQLKRLGQDPLVSLASHSHALHTDILANKWGGLQPAAVTKKWLESTSSIESDSEYYSRIHTDLLNSKNAISLNTGVTPQEVIWPYGWYNATTIQAAKDAGYLATYTLNNGTTDIMAYRRKLVIANMSLGQFKEMVTSLDYVGKPGKTIWLDLPIRQIKPTSSEEDLSKVINAVAKYDISKIVFSEYDESSYSSRVIWQIKNRTATQPYIDVSQKPAQAFKDLNILTQGAISQSCDEDALKSFKDHYRTNETYCYRDILRKVKDFRSYDTCSSLSQLSLDLKNARFEGYSDFILPSTIVYCNDIPSDLTNQLSK